MTWQTYGLDRKAQKLVLAALQRDPKSLNQSHKMRLACAYGLERFWGEHLRLQSKEPHKSRYCQETWEALVTIMAETGVTIPNDRVSADNPKAIQGMSQHLWDLSLDKQRVALAVLTQLCDCLVWWTQRYKGSRELVTDEED